MIASHTAPDQPPALEPLVAELAAYVRQAATAGTPAHEVERGIWTRILAVGRQALDLFFRLQGTGDVGETVTLPDGQTARRLPEHPRPGVPVGVRRLHPRPDGVRLPGRSDDRVRPPRRPPPVARQRLLVPAPAVGPGPRVRVRVRPGRGDPVRRPRAEAIDRQPGADEPADGRGRPPVPPRPAGPGRGRRGRGDGRPGGRQGGGDAAAGGRAGDPRAPDQGTEGEPEADGRGRGHLLGRPGGADAGGRGRLAVPRPGGRPPGPGGGSPPPGGQARVGQPDGRARTGSPSRGPTWCSPGWRASWAGGTPGAGGRWCT